MISRKSYIIIISVQIEDFNMPLYLQIPSRSPKDILSCHLVQANGSRRQQNWARSEAFIVDSKYGIRRFLHHSEYWSDDPSRDSNLLRYKKM